MRVSRILLAFCALLVAADNTCFLAQADESGECVTNTEGECINPDAVVEEPVVEEATPQEEETPEEVVTEPVEETTEEAVVVEEATEEAAAEEEVPATPSEETEIVEETTEEAVSDTQEATTDEAVSDTPEEYEGAPVEEETPQEDAVEEEAIAEEPVEEEVSETTTKETVTATDEEPSEQTPEETKPEEITTATDATEEPVKEETVEEKDEESTPGCPSRKHVIKCAAQYLDTNENNYLERAELQAAIDKLPWLSRGILSILGSVDKMMAKCDIDKDGAIGIDYDMTHNSETCLASCFKRRAFKAAFFPDCSA